MKKTIISLTIICLLFACQKEEDVDLNPTNSNSTTNSGTNSNTSINTTTNSTTTFNTTGQTLLLSGDFEAGGHPTSGKAKIYEDKAKKQTLVFEDFKTDAGPDLRIYLAEDKVATNFVEITNMVNNGNGVFTLPASANVTKQKSVLIWCKKFAVLFGSAQLK